MSSRLLRVSALGVPLFAAVVGLISACGDDEEGPIEASDASPDVPRIDARADSGGNVTDGGTDARGDAADSSITDSGGAGDADADAEPPLPKLCETYPNNAFDAGDGTQLTRYQVLARRAIEDGIDNAMNSCAIGGAFYDPFAEPYYTTCFETQLAELAGCTLPIKYESDASTDHNGFPCVTPGGPSSQLGFWDPEHQAYSANDVEFLIDTVGKNALAMGMAASDVERLKNVLRAQRSKAAPSESDAGYTHRHPDMDAAACP